MSQLEPSQAGSLTVTDTIGRWFAPERRSDLASLVALAALTAILFRAPLTGQATFIGDSDRLNTSLNVSKFEAESRQRDESSAWNEFMFMGFGVYGPLYFPDPSADLLALFPMTRFYQICGWVSALLFAAAGFAAYAFIKDSCRHAFAAFVGASLYLFSAYSILKISQADYTFAILAHIPLAMLATRRAGTGNAGACFLGLTLVLTSLMNFTFLQEASYAVLLVIAYAAYRSMGLRAWRTIGVFTAALGVALLLSAPRLYTAVEEFGLLDRMAPGHNIRDFASLYEFQNIRPREIFRWFNDGIFGSTPSEAVAAHNNINLHEGMLLGSGGVTALVILAGALRFRGRWLGLFRSSESDVCFHALTLVFVIAVVVCKPVLYLVYLAFMEVDLTHARIVVAGLLPMATLAAILLRNWMPRIAPSASSRAGVARWVAVASAATVVLALLRWIGDTAVFDSVRFRLRGFDPRTFVVVSQAALTATEAAFFVAILIVLRRAADRPALREGGVHVLGLVMSLGAFLNADFQINGDHTRRPGPPFDKNDFLMAASDDFRAPSPGAMERFHASLETRAYRSILIADPAAFPAFPAPHLSQFWRLRVVEGYTSGVPHRVAAFTWPQSVRSLRALSFPSEAHVPWRLLALLNVKYGLVVNEALYRNRADGREASPGDVTILVNPNPVTPREFFTRSVTRVADSTEAARWMESPGEARDLTMMSVAEGATPSGEFAVEGAIRAAYHGNSIDVELDPCDRPRFLVLNEMYHPRWRAFARDVELPVLPTNAVMRGIEVPPGLARIRLVFTPFCYTPGAIAIAATGLVILVVLCIALRSGPRTKGTDPS